MKETIFSVAISLFFLLCVGHFAMTIKPFSISLPYWHRSLGLLLLVAAFVIFNIGERSKGYEEGLKKGSDMTWEAIEKFTKENKAKQ
ncbi:hypothetical protein [Bacteroides reticulotermitis]|uniref:hypothetical protein n=1 Tax=Bacteroides reticulotermitis TaxID=1133319 RepID=UPI003A877007